MNNLLKMGIKQETIDKLIENEDYTSILAINVDVDNTYRILLLFSDLGVSDLDYYLLNYTILFSKDFNEYKELLNNVDIDDIKAKTEKDINYLAEYLLELI